MPREPEPSLNERQFFTQALRQQLRLDARPFDQFRPITLAFAERYGVVDLSLGGTRIHAHVSAEVTQPYPDRPYEGLFTIVTELSPMTHAHLEPGRNSPLEMLVSRLLEKTIRRSGALDPESLCLLAGQTCWSIRVDVHVLSVEGNLIDAASIAVIAALAHFKRPETNTVGGEVTLYTLAEREPVPLSLLHWPLCITFSFYKDHSEGASGEDTVLLDANELEEHMREGSMTIGMNKHGEICQLVKLGGAPVDAASLLKCVNLASMKVKEVSDIIAKQLQEDAKKRDKGGVMAGLLSSENARIPS
ncbi:BgTH12-07993 [Blumeria graminis f. sp. triticale]|uniref:Exosome complex component RRP45 n=3 Tax=Blumeria graminis TaxID=34373 RepID=E7DZJ3_BLUGR|nr:exosome complex exonuclease [Blumeria graminis f. sp. tritici]EPQ63047.1 hypothetical protein BGT96224_1613 [Blumeria graminis f. sp. tritici 96224]CAD6506564.1 BgTH12-07993 [Blumeria graminis f. sp. triticale]VDB96421.1 Bgt-1613 [Blumeria graminis f. sp. tritici]